MKTKEEAIAYFENQIADAKKGIQEFAKELEESPVYALEWSASVFSDAAKKQIAEQAIRSLAVVDFENFIAGIQREILSGARRQPRSSSPASNLMEEELKIALARAYSTLTGTL